VPGGKLLYVRVEYDNNTLKNVQILGDFFAYPESGVRVIERALAGGKLEKEGLIETIKNAMEDNGIELVGIDAEAIAGTIMRSVV
jgi:hypothetical protein